MVGQIQDVSLASLVNRRKEEEDKIRKHNEDKPLELFRKILEGLYADPMQDIEIPFNITEWDLYGRKAIQLCKRYGLVVIETVPDKNVYVSVSIPSGV